MPFLKDFIINDFTKIKLWEVNIGELDNTELDKYDYKLLKQKKNQLAREQFLAIRKSLILENPIYKIRYNKLGKPIINSKLNISISHSNNMAGIVFSSHSKIGLDIQFKESKILDLKDKFLNEQEKLKINNESYIDYLTMIWTAKESIYKALGIKGISFSKNIIIKKDLEEKRSCRGYYINENIKNIFNLNFFYVDRYTICFAYQI